MKTTTKQQKETRLVVKVPSRFHKKIKISSAELGMTMSAYIIQSIIERMDNDKNR